jgi:hypothetical protein
VIPNSRTKRALALVGTLLVALLVAASASAASSGPPVNSGLPVISGTLVQGQTLASTPGAWTGAEPLMFAFQWQRCDSGGSGCTDISGATASHYALTASDVGHRLRVGVGASNSSGAAAVLSVPTGVVAALPAGTTTTTTTTTTPKAPAVSAASCKHDGWRTFTSPRFRNQGQCVRFFVHEGQTPRTHTRSGSTGAFDFSKCRMGCKQHITITKDFVPNPNNPAVTVDILLNGTTVAGLVGDGNVVGPIGVEPGSWTIGERGASLAHYTGTIICTGETVAGPLPHTITVPKGGSVVCTITNTFH